MLARLILPPNIWPPLLIVNTILLLFIVLLINLQGEGKKLTACATKLLAIEHDLPVEQPINFKNQNDQAQLTQYKADLMIVVAYGLLLPEVILSAPRLGCINVHGSLLPKWRGGLLLFNVR